MARWDRRGFTLVELMIAMSVISMMVGMLLPVLARARASARGVHCTGNLRQLGQAWQMYADDHRGYCMPQVWFAARPFVYWWGAYSDPPDYTKGFLYPYIVGSDEHASPSAQVDGVFDCPEQPWGSYIPQGAGRHPTTTYGYNGLYLCPFHSGWGGAVRNANTTWRTTGEILSGSEVFVFADTLLDWGKFQKNNCLLDGPQMPAGGGGWARNNYPTLCFRHGGSAGVLFADGHAGGIHESHGTLTSPAAHVGYVGEDNAPHYVPDWRSWQPH